jgi:hypothetical protein
VGSIPTGATMKDKILNVTIGFNSDDKSYNWKEVLEDIPGFKLISEKIIENVENDNFPKWNFIINYEEKR